MNNILGVLAAAKSNPEALYKQMLNTNPQFKQFVEANKNKTPEQIAQENGVDLTLLRQLLK